MVVVLPQEAVDERGYAGQVSIGLVEGRWALQHSKRYDWCVDVVSSDSLSGSWQNIMLFKSRCGHHFLLCIITC